MLWLTEKYRKKDFALEMKYQEKEVKLGLAYLAKSERIERELLSKMIDKEMELQESLFNKRERLADSLQYLKDEHCSLRSELEATKKLSKELSNIEDIRVACKDVLIEALREQIRGLLPHGNQSVVQTMIDNEKSKESVNNMLKNG